MIEYFLIRTDQTAIGENFIHKVLGIALLYLALRGLHLTWSEIGFENSHAGKRTLKGLLLGTVCFSIAYAAELFLLSFRGYPAHLEFYVSGFSLTGDLIRDTGMQAACFCLLFNLINVFMEEGVFRGFFINIVSERGSFFKANLTAALLFGIWHFVMPLRSFFDGEADLSQVFLLSAGYLILSGLMSVKWGLLYRMTGSLWTGMADHFVNNAAATNLLHVVSESGADELQILRVLLAQTVSFTFVALLYRRRCRKEEGSVPAKNEREKRQA